LAKTEKRKSVPHRDKKMEYMKDTCERGREDKGKRYRIDLIRVAKGKVRNR
jgi:hypothetical protein